jgi:hypothetical protein
MKKKILFLLMILIFLVGCGKNTENIEANDEFQSLVETAIVQTLAAALPEDVEPTLEEEPAATIPPDPGPTLTATAPPLPTLSPTDTPDTTAPTNTPQTPCYRAELVSETIPDYTTIQAGTVFYKNWTIRNTGVCEWTPDFRWVHVEGEDFKGWTDVTLERTVLPGEEVTVKMELKAPVIPGTYKGTYQILSETGGPVTPFGFFVLIISE